MRASESDRSVICPAALVLPRTREANAKRDKAAAWGKAMHSWVETGATDDEAVERKVLLSGIDRAVYWPDSGRHEVTFAIDLSDGLLKPYKGPRALADEWKAAHTGYRWLTGTIDYLGTHKGRPWVSDLKTGNWPVDAKKSRQLRSYLLYPWLLEGRPLDATYYRSIDQWPRYPLDNLPVRNGLDAPVTGLDLATHLDDLLWAAEHPEVANPTTDGCRFCECRPHCNAYKETQWPKSSPNETATMSTCFSTLA
jgi:hypothetical protein